MRNPILPNRVAALAIVALTLAAAASLVGTDQNAGALSTATQALAEKAAQSSNGGTEPEAPSAAQTAALTAPSTSAPATPSIIEGGFAEEENLIDDASGFDPSPEADDPAQGEVVAIIDADSADDPATTVVIEEP